MYVCTDMSAYMMCVCVCVRVCVCVYIYIYTHMSIIANLHVFCSLALYVEYIDENSHVPKYMVSLGTKVGKYVSLQCMTPNVCVPVHVCMHKFHKHTHFCANRCFGALCDPFACGFF